MKADRSSETTSIGLGREDREAIERGENLRGYFLFDFNNSLEGMNNLTKLVFRVRNNAEPDPDQLKFSWYEPPKLDWMERGWYFETYPPIYTPSLEETERHYKGIEDYPENEREFIKELYITIDKENWQKLLLEEAIVTRWRFDRLNITYCIYD